MRRFIFIGLWDIENYLDRYRYGFNGQEKDDEIAGAGNINTAEFWQYDTRLGKRWNLDPISSVGISQYACFNNNPIVFIDPKGDYSKVGAKIRNFFSGGSGVYIMGEGKHKDWGYNTVSYGADGKQDGIIVNFGGTRKNASSFGEVLKNSLWHHSDYTDITGTARKKIINAPEMVDYNKQVMGDAINRYKADPKAFSYTEKPKGLKFGGDTDDPLNPLDPQTQDVAMNELTWITRHADITASIDVQKNGAMSITYLLMDDLDLIPGSGHGFQYNAVTSILGPIYHGMLWGKASKIRAVWTVKTQIKK